MRNRKFGAMDFEASALGFGAMRLPTAGGETGPVDEPAAIEMVRLSIDQGVNYLDTAYPYHGGASETVLGKALRDGYRARVKLATKMPCWLIEKPSDFDRYLDEQLRRLETDRVEFYLLHALWSDRWVQMKGMKVLEWAERARADGRIGELGFSFHGTLPLFREILAAYDWKMCQIQYNLLDEDVQAGSAGLALAAERGLAVAVMEPLLGGALARPPPAVARIWKDAGRDPVEVALAWLWDKPEISVVLSGMTSLEQVRQNLELAARSRPGMLSQEERELVTRVQAAYRELEAIPCTKCDYCLPCPNGVDIPRNYELYNQAAAYGNENLARSLYNWHMPEKARARTCSACGECEEKCPQSIDAQVWMARVHERLALKDAD